MLTKYKYSLQKHSDELQTAKSTLNAKRHNKILQQEQWSKRSKHI